MAAIAAAAAEVEAELEAGSLKEEEDMEPIAATEGAVATEALDDGDQDFVTAEEE
jgi:hypothetical protein